MNAGQSPSVGFHHDARGVDSRWARSDAGVPDPACRIFVSMLRAPRNAHRVATTPGIARATLCRAFAELGTDPAAFAGAAPDAGTPR